MKNKLFFTFLLLLTFKAIADNATQYDYFINDLCEQKPDYDLSYRDGEYPINWTVWTSNDVPGRWDWNKDNSPDYINFSFNDIDNTLSIQSSASQKNSNDPIKFIGGHFDNEQSERIGRFILEFKVKFKNNSEGTWFFHFYSLRQGSSPFYLSGNHEGKIVLGHNEFGVLAESEASSFKIDNTNEIELFVLPKKVKVCVNNRDIFEFHFSFKEQFGNSFWEIVKNPQENLDIEFSKISLWKIEKERVSQLLEDERDFFLYDSGLDKLEIQQTFLKSGSYNMGHPSVTGAQSKVYLGAFSIGTFPITYGEWNEISYWAENHGFKFKNKASHGKTEYTTDILTLRTPASRISWYDAIVWCNALSEYENKEPMYYLNEDQTIVYKDSSLENETIYCKWNANGYRLPTEAEWEYAARSAGTTEGNLYSGFNDPKKASIFNENPHYGIVDALSPNSLGIFDMSGNTYEWCWDWFSEELPSGNNPHGPLSGSSKITRGASSYSPARSDSFRERGCEPFDDDWSCLRIVTNGRR